VTTIKQEDDMSQPTGARITELATVAVPVSDQDRALEFYVGTLGFTKHRDIAFGGSQRWVEVAPTGVGTTIALVPAGEGAPVGPETGIRLITEDADADHAYLVARGVDTDPAVLRWPGVPAMFGFRDPDGNRLVLIERS
jgi:catechol 2,3-dioxygenase-like lactoylglutathione lyase family enzyme